MLFKFKKYKFGISCNSNVIVSPMGISTLCKINDNLNEKILKSDGIILYNDKNTQKFSIKGNNILIVFTENTASLLNINKVNEKNILKLLRENVNEDFELMFLFAKNDICLNEQCLRFKIHKETSIFLEIEENVNF
jgi:GH15 family glucan-1,4-alpha-glucosidase